VRPEQETLAFVEALLGGAPEHLWTLFWTLQDKRSHWEQVSQGPASLTEKVQALVEGNDVYISVSVSESPFGPARRIGNAEASGIMGLWADIDIADPDVHKKWNLPPDEGSAFELLGAVGLPPSVVVHSGHGLQAWWLFDEFWEFGSEEERLRAAQLAQAWNTTLRVRASERNWVVDSTFDLARVMRVPGTQNRKGGDAVPVRLLEANELRYAPSDFEGVMVDETVLAQLGLTPQNQYVVDKGLVLDSNAEPPFSKFSALSAAEPLFQKSWDRTRTTRDLPDQSPSSYDMSLASFAAQARWTDQEIANLIIASRRHHRDDLKLRVDYYRRTISKAHESMDRTRGAEMIDEVADELAEAKSTGDDEQVRASRRSVLDTISKQLGIEVVKVIKFKSTPPSYRLVTPTGGISVGSAKDMLSQNEMRAMIAAETAHLIARFKAPDWDRLMRVIFQAAEEQDVGMESTEAGQVYVWLSDYMLSRRPVDSLEEATISLHPYVDGGSTYIFASPFKQWIWMNRGERVSSKDIGRMLHLFGCAPSNVQVRNEEGETTRAVWKLPPRDAWASG
jgi:hypothetical protein